MRTFSIILIIEQITSEWLKIDASLKIHLFSTLKLPLLLDLHGSLCFK